MDVSKIKLTRIINSVKHITTKDFTYRIDSLQTNPHQAILTRDGLTDFCNIVRYQQSNPNLKLHEAFESVVFMAKWN
mgnify:CR=1 FL=1